MMLPRHGSGLGMTARRGGADNKKKHASAELPYERLAPKGRIPAAVDWRGTGADGIVKDQVRLAPCGYVKWTAQHGADGSLSVRQACASAGTRVAAVEYDVGHHEPHHLSM